MSDWPVTGCWVRGPGCWSTWSAEFRSDDPPRRYHASPNITVEVGAALRPQELSAFDHHLTARWQLYTTLGPVLARSNVEHEPWPLHRAAVRVLDGNLVAAAGLPEPVDEPVGHWSPGVRTRISALRPVGAPDRRTVPAAVTQPVRRQMALATGYPADGRSPQLPLVTVVGSSGRFNWCAWPSSLAQPGPLRPPPGPDPRRPVVGLAAPAARRRDPPDRPPGHAHPAAARAWSGLLLPCLACYRSCGSAAPSLRAGGSAAHPRRPTRWSGQRTVWQPYRGSIHPLAWHQPDEPKESRDGQAAAT
jgi:hypothetical protein